MYKGLTTFCITFLTLNIHTASKSSDDLLTTTTIAPSIEAKANGDIYISSRQSYFEDSKIIDEIMALAEDGDVNSQHRLGDIYLKGKGVTKSDIVALMWFIVSEKNGHEQASENKQFTEQYMAIDQVRLAYKMAENWIKTQSN